ncbi:hypothetical protein [Hyphomicrobium sp.]|uniref:hypothetical protein n=1 Tax=Hyphomicrobium sp. TaxID=82 RepID=UPI000FB20789|nr:hypothetical protein [Hyphomicrobium sp.]RUP07742.1 MAG: hypothetical protein EKK38_19465 [Hyphomicrobium sp.]
MKKKPWQQFDKYYTDLIGDEFLMKARYFRKVQVETPEQFDSIAKYCEVDRRTAFYWAEIGRVFGELDVDEKRLSAIGWTKAQIIAKYISQDNCEELLTLAEASSAHDLALLMRGQKPVKGTRVVTLYLKPRQYKVFSKVILAHGGSKNGNGLVNKEAALTSALSKLGYGMSMK